MSKVEVNGPNAHPLFQKLKQIDGGGDIKWNFSKNLPLLEPIGRLPTLVCHRLRSLSCADASLHKSDKFLISGGTSVRRFGHREPLAQVESSILEAI